MITEEQKQNIFQLRKKGKSILAISIELRLGKATVYEWCQRFDPKKELNHTHKITENDKELIITKYKELNNLEKTSKYFKNLCGKQNIRSILINAGVYINKTKLIETINESSRRKSLNVINWKTDKKLKLVEYKGGKCELCGYNKCYKALDFHHKDPLTKDFDISSNSYSFEKMKKEADKCMLICSNCHRELHHNQTLGLP